MPSHPVTFSHVQTFDRKGTIPMSDLDTLTLPLLPLTTGVVLPGMVVTLTLESPEARAAVDAAASVALNDVVSNGSWSPARRIR